MPLLDHFPNLSLTSDQLKALDQIEAFLDGNDDVFILQGYAGSGKTTILKGLVDFLVSKQHPYQLMAPTGRAAKVLGVKTGVIATTVHKGIYSFDELEEVKEEGEEDSYVSCYKVNHNPEVFNTVFIVDEASMVSDILSEGEFYWFGSGKLLCDLIQYSRIQDSTTTCKILFVGDPAQLPPIGMNFSPALDPEYLQVHYKLTVQLAVMKEVKRQKGDNGILAAALNIRDSLTTGHFSNFSLSANGRDLFVPAFEEYLQVYKEAIGPKIIISYKNKTAQDLNRDIRFDKYGADLPPQEGDLVIVGANNYIHGLMNGEFGVVTYTDPATISRDIKLRKKGGEINVRFTWRSISLEMPDQDTTPKGIHCMMLENFLHGEAQLFPHERQALYVDFKIRHPDLKPKTKEFSQALQADPYFNCVMLKYGYAVNCHKAQGGEWPNAFIFWDYSPDVQFNCFSDQQTREGKTNSSFFRWAYTAITRASDKLFCINPPHFNSFTGMTFVGQIAQEAFDALTGKKDQRIDISIDAKAAEDLQRFGLTEESAAVQNHFLVVRTALMEEGIHVSSHFRSGYEIQYGFGKEAQKAKLKFWIDGKNKFKDKSAVIPSGTNSPVLCERIQTLLANLSDYRVVRDDSVIEVGVCEFEADEQRPFLTYLYDIIQTMAAPCKIQIQAVSHLNFRERYTFVREQELAVVDFEYDGKGFFGRVLPLDNQTNNQVLLKNIREIIELIRET